MYSEIKKAVLTKAHTSEVPELLHGIMNTKKLYRSTKWLHIPSYQVCRKNGKTDQCNRFTEFR